jgi:endonuclease/exonuclease/phosphatase family metal-dependent hydrolase
MSLVACSDNLVIASWNVGHRLGRARYRPEFVEAIPHLGADVICLNEYYPRQHDETARARLRAMGFDVEVSGPTTKVANLTLIASRVPMRRVALDIEFFDEQLPSNLLAVELPSHALTVIALRVPMYVKAKAALMSRAWRVLEEAFTRMQTRRALVIGDLNCSLEHRRAAGREHLARLLEGAWLQAGEPGTRTFFSASGRTSWVDHCLYTGSVEVLRFEVLKRAGDFVLADGLGALSDHAAIRATVAGQVS